MKNNFRPPLPPIRKPVPLYLPVLLLVLATVGTLVMQKERVADFLKDKDIPSKENLSYMFQDLKKEKLTDENPQGFIFNLSEDQVLSSLKSAQTYFDGYQDNRAQSEINRIIFSNASESAKQRARILESYLKAPDLTSFENIFDYQSVRENPYLYNNCYVRWKGRMSNLKMTDPGMTFDFLVGYETAQILEGIVPSYTDFQVRLDSALPMEILGRVEVLDKTRFNLRITSVRNLIEP